MAKRGPTYVHLTHIKTRVVHPMFGLVTLGSIALMGCTLDGNGASPSRRGGGSVGPNVVETSGAPATTGGATPSASPTATGAAPGTPSPGGGNPTGDILSGSGCTPASSVETLCDGKDDDCNGKVDDVDVGKDGICDCVSIGFLGKPGTYGSNDFQAWLAARGTKVGRVLASPVDSLTRAELDGFDMVILDWLARDYAPGEVDGFESWLREGHGMLALNGFSDDYEESRPNAFLARVGMAFSSSTTLPDKRVVTTFLPSPITEGLSSVTFYGGSDVFLVGRVAQGDKRLAFANLGDMIVGGAYESADGRTRAVAWGDEWIEFDTEWQSQPDVPRFWSNIVNYLAPKCQVPPPAGPIR